MSKIRIALGYTMSLGAHTFESIRYDFSVEDETKPGETTDQAFDRIYGYVENKLMTKVHEDRKNLARSENKSVRKATAPSLD